MTTPQLRFGTDLGGTKTEIIAIDPAGKELLRRRTPTLSHSYDAIIETLVRLVKEADRDLGGRGSVGIGIPGAASLKTGLIKNANTTVLIGHPMQADLEKLLDRPVRLANDANCFALSEAVDGAGTGASVVFGVILGTGTGGGIAVDGKIIPGVNAIAGEWGHNPLPWPMADELPGPKCYCGKNGCVETFLSGPGLQNLYRAATGLDRSATDIEKDAEAGIASAEAMMVRFEDRLARSLATVINVLDPDVIVLGGGLSNLNRIYENTLKILPKYVFSDAVGTRLVRAAHGDSSGVRGAAWLWARSENL